MRGIWVQAARTAGEPAEYEGGPAHNGADHFSSPMLFFQARNPAAAALRVVATSCSLI